MSRSRSPQAAARQAEREAKDAAKLRKEKRLSIIMVIAVAIVSLGLCVADFFVQRYRARQRHEQHHQLQPSGTKPLPPPTAQPDVPGRKPRSENRSPAVERSSETGSP